MATALSYNSIDMSYLLTQGIDQGPHYDPSRSDQLYTKLVLRVQSIIAPYTSPSSGGEDPTTVAARIRHMLTRPRRALTYSVGGVNYLSIQAASGNTGGDDANGPKPLEGCRVVPIGQGAFLVNWAVEVCITDCSAGESTGHLSRGYLSLRWSETTSIDANWYTTKRRSGLMIVSSRGRDEPDALRVVVTPVVDQGFRREQAEYSLSEDGLHYRFTFVDRELHRPPPYPATKMSGQMIESVPLPGAKRRGQIHVRLEGPRIVSSRDLLNKGIAICMQRAREGDIFHGKGGRLFVGGSFKESLNDNENSIEVTLEYLMKPSRAREKGSTNRAGAAVATSLTPGMGLIPGLVLNPANIVSPGFGTIVAAGNALSPSASAGSLNTTTIDGKDTQGLPIHAGWVGKPLFGVDPTRGVAPPTRGTADQVKLIAAVLRDPCGAQMVTNEIVGGPNTYVQTNRDGSSLTVNTLSHGQPPDDFDAKFDDPLPGVWDHYIVRTTYHDDSGKRVLPPTSRTGSATVVQLHAPYMRCKLEWSVARIGGPLVIPAKESPDPNVVYLYGDVELPNVEPSADGVSMRQECSGVYYYSLLNAAAAVTAAPIPPFVEAQLTMNASQLLVAPSPVGSSGGTPATSGTGPASTPQPPTNPPASGGPTSYTPGTANSSLATQAGANAVASSGSLFNVIAQPSAEPTNTGNSIGAYTPPPGGELDADGIPLPPPVNWPQIPPN